MLTFFPAPYPGEWWYSVLCRFHVRTGNHNHQTTIRELFHGKPKAAMGTLFPNSTVHQIISQLLPPWDCQSIILQYTLFPYYTRMYTKDQKEKMLSTLCDGESVTLTHIWRATTKKKWSLRYCPACVQEDTEKYGEPYWHREHQLSLASVCCTHHCRLQSAGEADPRLSEMFYPLSMIDNIGDAKEPAAQWEGPLSTILRDYLTLPQEVGPTTDHNNLAQALANKGYGIIRSNGTLSLDARKIYKGMMKKYGSALTQEIFGNEISAFVLNRIVKWNLTSPERYALLQNFVDLPTTTMFSGTPVEDRLCVSLQNLAKRGVTFGKRALAEQLGIKPFQLDVLAKKYAIQPFWEQNGTTAEKKTNMLKLHLTAEEREDIHQAAQQLGFRYDTHFVRYCVEQMLKKQP